MNLAEKMKNEVLYSEKLESLDELTAKKWAESKELLYDFNHTRPREMAKRKELLDKILASHKEHYYFEPPFNANWGCNLHIGENFYANFNLTIVDDTDIFIGDDVMIAPNVIIATGTHPVLPELRKEAFQYNLPVHIGDCVWIGAGSIILPGVTIGDGSVIGAGSVVTKDIPANVVAVGNPCKVLREISDRDKEYYYKDRKIEWEKIKK